MNKRSESFTCLSEVSENMKSIQSTPTATSKIPTEDMLGFFLFFYHIFFFYHI